MWVGLDFFLFSHFVASVLLFSFSICKIVKSVGYYNVCFVALSKTPMNVLFVL